MRGRLVIFFVFLFTMLVTGCAQFAPQEKKIIPIPQPSAPLMATRQDLERRIVSLQERIEKSALSAKDRTAARELLGIYRLLREAAILPLDQKGYGELINRIYERAGSLDSALLSVPQNGLKPDTYAISLFLTKQRDVVDTYLSGDHRAVINKVLEIKKAFGADSLSPQVGLLFALSLAHEGMLEEAVDVGEHVAEELEQRPGLILLEKRIAQWYSRLGREDAAMLRYERLTDVLDEKRDMLASLKKELTRSSVTSDRPSDQGIAGKSEISAIGSGNPAFKPLMGQVEEHIQAHDFEGARNLLIKKKKETLSHTEVETIDQALKSVDKAEDVFHGERVASLSREKKALQNMRRLMEDEKYDEAISGIEEMRSEGIQSAQLKNLELEATEKLIDRDRKRAAGLFLKAKKTEGVSEKRLYLSSSRELLQNLLDRFPSSPSYAKVKRNLEIVDEALGRL